MPEFMTISLIFLILAHKYYFVTVRISGDMDIFEFPRREVLIFCDGNEPYNKASLFGKLYTQHIRHFQVSPLEGYYLNAG